MSDSLASYSVTVTRSLNENRDFVSGSMGCLCEITFSSFEYDIGSKKFSSPSSSSKFPSISIGDGNDPGPSSSGPSLPFFCYFLKLFYFSDFMDFSFFLFVLTFMNDWESSDFNSDGYKFEMFLIPVDFWSAGPSLIWARILIGLVIGKGSSTIIDVYRSST